MLTRELLSIRRIGEGSDIKCALLIIIKKMLSCIFQTSVCRPDSMNAICLDFKYCRTQGCFSFFFSPTAAEEYLQCLFQLMVWQITNKCRWDTETGNIETIEDYAARTGDYFACLTKKVLVADKFAFFERTSRFWFWKKKTKCCTKNVGVYNCSLRC